ncbi:uncharacterized protein E0L32_007753 [Thyridium curvatum]|uniref:Uncharacterized protein n=1 Tax=Thyridium curvatum TaxID=1093900 RepID=A0A507ANQ3_9PEZI|nr:uncharacterized protein E0L32_007753 [Thyridium curvatum]TPX11542.1 hypothetical protein E0L32_007753 [Thyridium curvatum]
MAVPGIIMRFAQPRPGRDEVPESSLAPPAPAPNVEAFYMFEEQDGLQPKYNTTYFLSDITPVLNDPEFYNDDVKAHSEQFASIAWEVCGFLNGRDTSEAKELSSEPHILPKPPAIGSTLVSNGGTPGPGWEQDYVDWYTTEHSAKLSLVPGWNNCRRYRHDRTYGEVDVATYYGWNYYDAENGLGGPVWQDSLTGWTIEVRKRAAKPNLRRVWKVVKTNHP